MSAELGRQMGKAWARYVDLNQDYQTCVRFLSREEQIKWHEENSPKVVEPAMEEGVV